MNFRVALAVGYLAPVHFIAQDRRRLGLIIIELLEG